MHDECQWATKSKTNTYYDCMKALQGHFTQFAAQYPGSDHDNALQGCDGHIGKTIKLYGPWDLRNDNIECGVWEKICGNWEQLTCEKTAKDPRWPQQYVQELEDAYAKCREEPKAASAAPGQSSAKSTAKVEKRRSRSHRGHEPREGGSESSGAGGKGGKKSRPPVPAPNESAAIPPPESVDGDNLALPPWRAARSEKQRSQRSPHRRRIPHQPPPLRKKPEPAPVAEREPEADEQDEGMSAARKENVRKTLQNLQDRKKGEDYFHDM